MITRTQMQNLLHRGRARQRATPVAVGPHVVGVIGLGTTGKRAVEAACRRAPTLRGSSLIVTAEAAHEEQQQQNLIAVPDVGVGDFVARRGKVALVRDDELFATITFPSEAEQGAGTCRTIGLLKGAFLLDTVRQQLTRLLRRRLNGIETGDKQRLVVTLHLVAAAGGGFGSALLIPVSLIARDEVRRHAPQARCYIVAHLVLGSVYAEQIADEATRNKVQANDLGTLLELNYAEQPAHVRAMCEALGAEPVSVACVDQIIPYDVGDEHGATLSLDQIVSQRVTPNILVAENAGVANRLRELGSNVLAARASDVTHVTIAHPVVAVAQAAVALVPVEFGRAWALKEVQRSLEAELGKASPARVRALEVPAKALLGVETLKTEVARLCGEPLTDVLTVARALTKLSATKAHAMLSETYDRYHATVRPGITAKAKALVQHHRDVTMPELGEKLVGDLAARGATVTELGGTLKSLIHQVIDFKDRILREAAKHTAATKAACDEYQSQMQRLVSQPFLAGSIKKSAALALNKVIEAENQTIRCTLLSQLVSNIIVELSRLVEDLKLVHREAVRSAGVLKSRFRECRELSTAQTTTFRSVIKADEFETALAHLDSGIRGANEALPALGVAELMRAGQLGVAEQIEKVVEARTTIYDQYFEATLCDVTGTVKALKLSFSVEGWLTGTFTGLACCSPLRLGVSGHVEPQTMVVAAGDDAEAVAHVLRRNPTLADIDQVPGSDPRSIVIYRRAEGLTIEAVPSFIDARRAARSFPRPGSRPMKAWHCLASSGAMLPAFEQQGLVPEEWIEERPFGTSRLAEAVSTAFSNNGD